MPWHLEDDQFWLLAAELLLARTTRRAVAGVYEKLREAFPAVAKVAEASPDDLWEVLEPTGLKKRALWLQQIATVYDEDRTRTTLTYDEIRALPGVGPYVAAAVELYSGRSLHMPVDSNIKRVLGRFLGENPSAEICDLVVDRWGPTLPAIHLGILRVAWEHCRATPQCGSCPVSSSCQYAIERRE